MWQLKVHYLSDVYEHNLSTPKHKTKHKLEKWFIISGNGVRTYVCNVRTYKTKQNKPIKPLFKPVLGRGSLYESSLVMYNVQLGRVLALGAGVRRGFCQAYTTHLFIGRV